MNYELEPIAQEDWEHIRESADDTLRATTVWPDKRIVDYSSGNFLVELGNNDHRGELSRRCLFFFSGRSMHVSFSDGQQAGTKQIHWTAWKGIKEHELTLLNSNLIKAFSLLYGFSEVRLITSVYQNPFRKIARDDLIYMFDSQILLWFETKRLRLLNSYTEELVKGKSTLFKWRFYWLRWKGRPTFTTIEESLIGYLSSYFWNPKHLEALLDHLDAGGERFCDDTKRVLVFLRNRGR